MQFLGNRGVVAPLNSAHCIEGKQWMDESTLLLLYNSRSFLQKFALYLELFIVLCILLVSSSSSKISLKSLLVKNLPIDVRLLFWFTCSTVVSCSAPYQIYPKFLCSVLKSMVQCLCLKGKIYMLIFWVHAVLHPKNVMCLWCAAFYRKQPRLIVCACFD